MVRRALSGWRNPEQIELVYTAMQSPWTQPRCQLRNISADGRTLTMAPCLHALPGGRLHGSLRWFMSGLPATIENAFELLEQPGEFYVDTAAAEVLYIPRPGEDMATAEVCGSRTNCDVKLDVPASCAGEASAIHRPAARRTRSSWRPWRSRRACTSYTTS